MKKEIKEKCYELSLRGYTYQEIAEKTNVSMSTVHRAISSITKSHDYQLGVVTMAQFIEKFARSGDYFELLKKELEEMAPEDNGERMKIISMRADMEARSLALAKQGQVVQAVKALKDGKMRLDGITGMVEAEDGKT